MIWDFEQHDWDQPEDEYRMLSIFNDTNLIDFHKSQLWNGCYGYMIVITHDHLRNINNKYDISKLLDLVLNRYNRSSFERVIACILQIDDISPSIFGDIHDYSKKYEYFIETIEDIPLYLNTNYTENISLIKMRLGR